LTEPATSAPPKGRSGCSIRSPSPLEEPAWWWNPLSYVTDEVKAARLADHFAAGSHGPDAKTDAYFDPAGQDLLAGLLLATNAPGKQRGGVYGTALQMASCLTNRQVARCVTPRGGATTQTTTWVPCGGLFNSGVRTKT
jgi:hypothetical protein